LREVMNTDWASKSAALCRCLCSPKDGTPTR
jgi:hypothetical protein